MNEITQRIYDNVDLLPEDTQGWNGDRPVFAELITELKPAHIIEIGTWKGQSAITMAKALRDQNIPGRITCVDTWLGALEFWHELKDTADRDLLLKNGYPQIYYQFLSNVVREGLQNYILPFPNTSFIASKYFKANKITAQLIYVDGSHESEDVMSDCTCYWDILEPGGIMFGDDWTWDSVRTAAEDFARIKELPIRVVEDVHWLIKKP
jgi:SAM-dependent methyltransferase